MINNVVLMFSPTNEKTPLIRAGRESYGHKVQSVAARSIVHAFLKRSPAWTKPERVLVYVIGLHAGQFGNNCVKKIPRTAKIGRGHSPSPIWLSDEFFEFN